MATIDTLDIKITSSSIKASKELEKLSNSLGKVNTSMSKTNTIFTTANLKFGAVVLGLRKISNALATSVGSINDYIENMNLFHVSMGEFYTEAKEYAELVQSKMGIDSSEWMRGQGVFMAMAKGFGIAGDKAYEMSKGMTELSYDMASFYNIPITEALTKMRSAMAGEIEPMRALGISLTEATLQEVALAKGITKKVNAMTEAEKSQLRYVAIVESAKRVGGVVDGEDVKLIGDFARTLSSPSNSIRILQQQFIMLGRAIGSVFIPIITKVMPYIQAFVKVLTNAISRLATLLGFKMPNWDNASWEQGATSVGDTAEALGNATKKAKEYKKQLQGFDELNIIPAPQEPSGGSGASGGVGGDLGLDIESVWKRADIEAINSQVDQIIEKFKGLGTTIKEAFASETVWDFIKVLGSIGAGIGILKLFDTLKKSFVAIGGASTLLAPVKKALTLILANVQAIIISFNAGGIGGVLSAIGAGIGGLLSAVAPLVAVASVVYVLWENFDKVVAVVKNFVEGIGLKETFEGIKQSLTPLMASLGGLHDLFTFIGTVILAILQPAIAVAMGIFTSLINVVKPIITIITGVIEIFGALGSFLVGIFTGDLEKIKESVKKMGEGIWNVFAGMVTGVINLVAGFVAGVIQWFISLWDELVGHSIIPDMAIAIMDWFKTMIDNVIKNVTGFVTSIISWVTTMGTNVVQSFKNAWSTAGQVVSNAWNGMIQGGKNAWEGIKNVFGKVGTFFKDTFSKAWQGVVKVFSAGGEIFKNIKDGIATAFKSVVNSLIKGINNVVSVPFNAINTALRTIRDISIMGIKPFNGLIKTISVPSIPLLASGGMVNTGQMFIARESGPELVGTIGGQSAVANNQQIVEGISAGVYEAVVKAMSGDGKNITINATFELDGNAIGKSVVKYHNGVVTQTGSSPLLI